MFFNVDATSSLLDLNPNTQYDLYLEYVILLTVIHITIQYFYIHVLTTVSKYKCWALLCLVLLQMFYKDASQ